MAVFRDLQGTTEGHFRVGLGGPRLKNSTGALSVRNAGDTADAALAASALTLSAVVQPKVVYIGTWAGKPAASGVTVGDKAIITDYGQAGRSEWFSNGTNWLRDSPLLLYAKGDTVASTTSSTEVALLTVPVLASSLGANGGVELEWSATYPNSAAAKEMSVRIGVGAFSTSFAQMYYRDFVSGAQQANLRAGFMNANSVSAQESTSPPYTFGYGVVNVAMATAAINTASDFNVFISAKMNGTESISLRACRARLIYGV